MGGNSPSVTKSAQLSNLGVRIAQKNALRFSKAWILPQNTPQIFIYLFQEHEDIGGNPPTSLQLMVAINLFKARCFKHLTNARKSIDSELEKLMLSIKELQRSWVRVSGPTEARIDPPAAQEHPCELSKYHLALSHSSPHLKDFFVANSPTARVCNTGSVGFLSTII